MEIQKLEYNPNDIDLGLALLACGEKDAIIIMSSTKNIDVGFLYDEGTHNERSQLIIAYLKQNPEILEKVRRSFNYHEFGK